MDVYESEQALRKHTRIDTPRPPLVPAEKNNAINTVPTIRPSRTREVSSRYKSPSVNRRCSSPNITRTSSSPSSSPSSHAQLVSKRAVSADRKRPSTPPSPSNLSSTLVNESSRRMSTGGKLPESLWPSTMRSLSVSFQSDTISIPISKKEKPVTNVTLDRTLRPALNVAHKQPETPSALSRKPTPERKRSPLKGKNAPDQSENSKPIDGLSTRLIDQHRWPSRIGGKVTSNASTKSMDHPDKVVRNSVSSVSASGLSLLRRTITPVSENSLSKSLQKSISDSATRLLSSLDESVDYNSSRPKKLISTNSSDRSTSAAPAARSQSLPLPGSRLPSPSRTSFLSSSRGVSPARGRPSTPPSRGVSPSRTRSSTISSSHQSTSSASVLSFIADVKKGRKSASYIDDAHQLRLLYNRYLQWRFANARAEAVLYVQQVTAEEILYNVLNATLSLWDSVVQKRINLQQLNLQLKLNSVLNDQMAYLDDWASLERDHVSSLSGIVEDLEASTLRVPLTGGAKADIESLNAAICSAVDVMKAMGSSICSLLSKAEDMNSLVSELAVLTTQEKTMLDECEAMLASSAALQVEEYSLRTNLIQMKPASGGGRRRR